MDFSNGFKKGQVLFFQYQAGSRRMITVTIVLARKGMEPWTGKVSTASKYNLARRVELGYSRVRIALKHNGVATFSLPDFYSSRVKFSSY